MVNLKRLIKEDIDSQIGITIDDITASVASKWGDRTAKITLGVIEDFYYSEDSKKQEYARGYIALLNEVFAKVKEIVSHLQIPYVNFKLVKSYLLELTEYRTKVDEFFPFPLYIAATRNTDGDWAEIGVMVDFNGKVLEIHEGNDESSPETIALANKLVNPSGKKVRVYGAHDTNLVWKIDSDGYLPTNLYMSPYKPHAESYLDLDGKRTLFTGIVDVNDFNIESDLDWKSVCLTKIEKFRYL